MAFIKDNHFVYEEETKSEEKIENKIKIPFVFQSENNKFVGFVPGFFMKKVGDEDLEVCKQKLFEFIKPLIKEKIEQKQQFPNFPSKEEIVKENKNVVLIKYLTFTINY